MQKLFSVLWVSMALLPSSVFAHGPTPQKAKESIVINAPVENVWDVVKNFGSIVNWHPDVKSSLGDGKHESGGIRTVVLQNGGELQDELDFYSDKDHEYSFRLKKENPQAFPVSSYTINLQVLPAAADTNKSEVTIKGRFYRGDTSNSPPENQNDAAAVGAMNTFIKHGLTGLQQKLEK
ncbi:Polyketide cyclase / dehydrase and lipid transport [Crenothrix polyspora]|uniref:Polyketide cyclase / dehydrase and lipid transport n=1 Tax=Crenothrix polyspora TaxID=360316 RepID=A0A1R4HBX6_9GAMM|nr:SRPBCC family protein [Crenothrix polyspora]SJM93762.1 Polyketide cyclase / dehydrase and lipid transport [Crenothrix polyspora]